MPPQRLLFVIVVCLAVARLQAKVCGTLDIRNNPSQFAKLKDCTVIAGNLKIVLMERYTEQDFVNLTFPALREIKEYMIVFRVYGLTTLGNLFPNLSVIHGEVLVHNYALIIYDNPDMKEIGLYKLSKIGSGSVKVDKNPEICFVETINWKKLGTSLYKDTRNEICEKCPNTCPQGYCWNKEHCQYNDYEQNCHPECLGCSKPNSVRDCYACRNQRDNGVCVPKCPANKYYHTDALECVTAEQCRDMLPKKKWWTLDGLCVKQCPLGYRDAPHLPEKCEPCNGTCEKLCTPPNVVGSLQSVKKLKGCTHINGSLIVRVTTKAVADELELLGSIEEISDYLKIIRSSALTDLTFLKNLRVIQGKKLENNLYALVIYENNNLHKLWDLSTFSLSIQKGTISSHNNRLLCLTEIKNLAKKCNLEYTSYDVSEHSNGHKSVCTTNNITMTVLNVNSNNVTIKWEELNPNSNNLYAVYWIEGSCDENITIFSNNNECEEQGWETAYTIKPTLHIRKLKPYTSYAYYIRASFSGEVKASSQIACFKTEIDDPSEILNLRAGPTNYSSVIMLTWDKPLYLNGPLSYYIITAYPQQDDEDFLNLRNYCTAQYDVEKVTYTNTSLERACWCDTDEIQFDNICSNLTESKSGSCGSRDYFLYSSDAHTLDTGVISRNTSRGDIEKYEVKGLRHYTLYVFYISACNDRGYGAAKCGPAVQVSARTSRKIEADDIPGIVTVDVSEMHAVIRWKEPRDPNALITSYVLSYDAANPDCITRLEFLKAGQKFSRKFQAGKHVVRVRAVSLAGPGTSSGPAEFTIVDPNHISVVTGIIIAIVMATLLVLGLIGSVCFYVRRKNQYKNRLITTINPDYSGTVYLEDEWEIDRQNIEINHELGCGTFGKVFNGLIKPSNIPCAIKTVNEDTNAHDRVEFLNEASVMKSFNTSNHVVRLLGVVSRGSPPLVIMELMERGDLKSYLRRSRGSSNNITCAEMYRMAAQIADGMAYLAAKKFVHRDLAARNCMVAQDRTVKVGDFGMARDVYETDYYKKETRGLLPVRWMAPESLADGVFTADSDVWSYGVVLWEMATLAEQPYQGLANDAVLEFVKTGGTMQRPKECPEIFWDIMKNCWMWQPKDRPLFTDIVFRLESYVGEDFQLVSFYHSREGKEHRMNAGERVINQPAFCGNREPRAYWNTSEEGINFLSNSASRPGSWLDCASRTTNDDIDVPWETPIALEPHIMIVSSEPLCQRFAHTCPEHHQGGTIVVGR